METNMPSLGKRQIQNRWALLSIVVGVLLWVFAITALWPTAVSYEPISSSSGTKGLLTTAALVFVPLAGLYFGWKSLKEGTANVVWATVGIGINGLFLIAAIVLLLLAMFGKV